MKLFSRINVLCTNFWVRDTTWDRATVESILIHDEYKIADLVNEIPAPRVVLDIGAHIGSFVIQAHKTWPFARIFAFEAFLDNFALLKLNTMDLPDVRVFHGAVVGDDTSADAEVAFRTPVPMEPVLERGPGTGSCCVDLFGDTIEPAISVNDVLTKVQYDTIDLMKIDCEGSEGSIFPALMRLNKLKYITTIIGEWHEASRRVIVEETLSPTHDIVFRDFNPTLGLFTAKLRK